MVILEETFAPPKIATTGDSPCFITLSMALTSLAKRAPKHFFLGKNFEMIVVEAWALCAVPNASFT